MYMRSSPPHHRKRADKTDFVLTYSVGDSGEETRSPRLPAHHVLLHSCYALAAPGTARRSGRAAVPTQWQCLRAGAPGSMAFTPDWPQRQERCMQRAAELYRVNFNLAGLPRLLLS